MYQLDSWYAVLFELLIVGFSFYNSLRMTKWWNTVKEGTAIGLNGATRVPSVAEYYGIHTETKMELRSCEQREKARTPEVTEMGDGIHVH